MEDKQTYFVTANGNIETLRTDDHLHYFEIRATYREKQELEHLIFKIHENHKQEGLDIFTSRKFDERYAMRERQNTSEYLFELYRLIYLLGTEETKNDIEEMGVLPRLHERT